MSDNQRTEYLSQYVRIMASISDTPLVVSKLTQIADRLDEQNERIKRLEEMYEGEIGENEQFLGSNLQGLLTRELNWSKQRIKRLEEAGDAMAAWLLDPRNLGGGSSMASQWYKSKEAKP